MRYRQFLHNGKPTDRVDSTEGNQFGAPDDVGIEEVAAALGVPVDEVSVRHLDEMPASVPDVVIPPQESAPPPVSKVDALLEAIAGAKDLAELKSAVRELR